MSLPFHTLDVFTDTPFGGNQLAVVLEAGSLDEAAMQRIAREFSLSETAFVLARGRAGATHRVRIFTPGRELPFAGHPTVGTAVLLALLDDPALGPDGSGTLVFDELVGAVPVAVRRESDRRGWAQLTAAMVPERGPAPPERGAIAAMLGLAADDLLDDGRHAAEPWSAGTPFLVVPVTGLEALSRIRFDTARWERLLAGAWAPAVYAFCADPASGRNALRGRMFAPDMGITEDPATGAAVSALAGYLAARESADGPRRWTIRQGIEMERPSLLEVDADVRAGTAERVRVSGRAVLMSSGTIHI